MTTNSGVYITDQPFTLGLPVRPPSISVVARERAEAKPLRVIGTAY
jgi:hypothetical protein